MRRTTKIVSINKTPEEVIEYISKVKNHPGFIPPLKNIENVGGDEKVSGTKWDWTYVMGGIEIKGQSETVNYEPGKVFQYKTTGDADSVFTYSAEPSEGGSRLTVDVEYEIPKNVLGNFTDEETIIEINEKDADSAAENIKTILEG